MKELIIESNLFVRGLCNRSLLSGIREASYTAGCWREGVGGNVCGTGSFQTGLQSFVRERSTKSCEWLWLKWKTTYCWRLWAFSLPLQTFHPSQTEEWNRGVSGGGKVGVSPFRRGREQNRKPSPCFGLCSLQVFGILRWIHMLCSCRRSGQSMHAQTQTRPRIHSHAECLACFDKLGPRGCYEQRSLNRLNTRWDASVALVQSGLVF